MMLRLAPPQLAMKVTMWEEEEPVNLTLILRETTKNCLKGKSLTHNS